MRRRTVATVSVAAINLPRRGKAATKWSPVRTARSATSNRLDAPSGGSGPGRNRDRRPATRGPWAEARFPSSGRDEAIPVEDGPTWLGLPDSGAAQLDHTLEIGGSLCLCDLIHGE